MATSQNEDDWTHMTRFARPGDYSHAEVVRLGVEFPREGYKVLAREDDTLWTRRTVNDKWEQLDVPADLVGALRVPTSHLIYAANKAGQRAIALEATLRELIGQVQDGKGADAATLQRARALLEGRE